MAFTQSGFLHVETPLVGILYCRLAQVFEGASDAVSLGVHGFCFLKMRVSQLGLLSSRTGCVVGPSGRNKSPG